MKLFLYLQPKYTSMSYPKSRAKLEEVSAIYNEKGEMTHYICPMCETLRPMDWYHVFATQQYLTLPCKKCKGVKAYQIDMPDVVLDEVHESIKADPKGPTKVCRRCEKEKATTEFFKDPSRGDGFMRLCKPCSAEVKKLQKDTKALKEKVDATKSEIIEEPKEKHMVIPEPAKHDNSVDVAFMDLTPGLIKLKNKVENKQKCRRCNELKPVEKFTKDKKSPSGHNNLCLACGSALKQEARDRKKTNQ
jgi:hypothetical protein